MKKNIKQEKSEISKRGIRKIKLWSNEMKQKTMRNKN